MTDKAHHEREHFFAAAKVVSGLTVVSRVFGMVRDMAIASLGATRLTSAFVLAFRIPNLFRRLFGEGALSAAFVPVFTETTEKGGPERARRLFANSMGLLAMILLALMIVGGAALLVWGALFPGHWDRQLVLKLTGVMLPFMFTICLLALGSAVLQCRGHFAYPAFAPILLNIIIIIAAWGVAPLWRGQVTHQLFIIAGSVTVAGVVQLAAVLWLLRRRGFPIRPRVRPVEPGIAQMLKLMAPMVLGLGFLQIVEFASDIIAWILSATDYAPTIHIFGRELQRPLSEGVLMRVYTAQRLYQFPMGVLAISLAVAVFPLLSRYAARGDLPNLRDSLNRALRLAIMEGLAAGVGLFLLAEPITRLVFIDLVRLLGRSTRFTPEDADVSARVLRMYSLGMWAYCTHTIFLRAFYSLKDVLTPLKVSCALVVLGPLLVALLVWVPQLGPGAFGVAMTVTAAGNVLVFAVLLRRRLGRLGGRKLATSALRSAVAAGVMAAAVVGLQNALGPAPSWLIVVTCVPAGAAVFLLAVLAMRSPELRELWGRPSRAKQTSEAGYNGAEKQ